MNDGQTQPEKIIFVAHGSPKKINHDDFFSFFNKLKTHFPTSEFCFIEHGEPNFKDKFTEIEKNESLTKVIVQPLLLFRAGHLADIEKHIPSQKFEVKKAISEADDFPDFYAGCLLDWIRTKNIDSDNPLFIFVGRGSSNQTANSEFYKICRLVWEKIKKGYIMIAFAEVTRPSVQEVLTNTITDNFEKIFIVPVILFRGYVIEKITKDISDFIQKRKPRIYIAPPVARISEEKFSTWIANSIKQTPRHKSA